MPKATKAKKLVLVSATSASVTGTIKEAPKMILERVSCIHYPMQFRKNRADNQALINSGSEVNTMTPAYPKKLGFWTQKTKIEAQKIDESSLNTFEMVIAGFQVIDKLGSARIFQETFLLANTGIEVILKMLFLTFNNADI